MKHQQFGLNDMLCFVLRSENSLVCRYGITVCIYCTLGKSAVVIYIRCDGIKEIF